MEKLSRPVLREDPKEIVLREEAGIGWCKGPEAALSLPDGGDRVERRANSFLTGY